MRWFHVFAKGVKEQVRDFWILITIVVMAPLFIALYSLMSGPENVSCEVIVVNHDLGYGEGDNYMNLGDSLFSELVSAKETASAVPLRYMPAISREAGIEALKNNKADVLLVFPEDLSGAVAERRSTLPAMIELVGDITRPDYLVGAVWTEELVGSAILEKAAIDLPVAWTETTLGHSGDRTAFELYVPGLLILSVIMIIFSASAAIVRESETRTLERLKISRLTALEFLTGLSLVQVLIAALSLTFALLTAILLGYTLIPGTLGTLIFISMLTALSMISFSLIVASMCRSIKEVAIIGTFPLFLLMFFTGAAFPISGGRIMMLGGFELKLNHLLSPTWAVDALNRVLVTGADPREIFPNICAITVLTVLYFIMGSWLFKIRHMRAR